MVERLSTLMGETAAHTQNAVAGTILTLLAGLIDLSASERGPTRLVNLMNHRNYEGLLNNLSGLLDEDNTVQAFIASGQDILSTLFPDKLSAVSALIAKASGVTGTSASSLLSLTAPVVVGVLGRVQTTQRLDAVGLTTLLLTHKEDVLRLAPPGVAGVLGWTTGTEFGAGFTSTAIGASPNRKTLSAWELRGKDSGRPPWGWLLVGIVVLGVVYCVVGTGDGGEAATGVHPATNSRTRERRPVI